MKSIGGPNLYRLQTDEEMRNDPLPNFWKYSDSLYAYQKQYKDNGNIPPYTDDNVLWYAGPNFFDQTDVNF